MAASSLQNLAEQFCELIGEPTPNLTVDEKGMLAFSATVRGVDLTVTHDPVSQPADVLVLIFFGMVPAHREVEVLRELLHANLLMLQPGAPSFSRNPLTGSVILQYALPLAGASGQDLLLGMEGIIDTVLKWREDFFLETDGLMEMPLGSRGNHLLA